MEGKPVTKLEERAALKELRRSFRSFGEVIANCQEAMSDLGRMAQKVLKQFRRAIRERQ